VPRPRTITDEAIVAATVRAIDRHGPARMTLADVAREAGVSPAALVQRFGSKHALLVAVGRSSREHVERAAADALGRTGPYVKRLLDLLSGFVRDVDTPEVLANHVAFLQLDLVDPELRAEARGHARALLHAIRALLDAAVDHGELRRDADTRRLAAAVHTTYNGALVSWALVGRGGLGAWVRSELSFVLEPYGR
jgi:AcrR family transcriptional regulator